MNLALARENGSELAIVKATQLRAAAEECLMKIRTSGYIAALVLGVATFAGPAAAQFKGVGGHGGAVGAPHVGGAGMAAHRSFGAGIAAHPNLGGAGFAGRNSGAAPLMTGRSVAGPNAGFAAAAGTPKAGFTGRPAFTAGPAARRDWRGGNRQRFWPYAAAAAGAGIAYGVGAYGYDYPYDAGYYDEPGYDAAPVVAPAALDAEGGSCATPVLICRLYEPAEIGLGCTCTVNGGPVRGVVQP
ncbi:MAG: hypothetical protein QOH65_1315 [Methylobacteriaceae bacterium]|nr:hypothetical protein [Methylobacteriaceae bacterium]